MLPTHQINWNSKMLLVVNLFDKQKSINQDKNQDLATG